MIQSNKLSIGFKYGTLLLCLFWLGWILFNNEIPADVGDGLMHFFIAQASWNDAHLFLDHWGKPLFTLLSSTFAQTGFFGYVIFNILVFGITILVAYRIFNKSNVSNWLQGLFPLILLTANDVVVTITGGLTEPLFNLFLVLAIYWLIHKKWLLFAIFISFMPFLRSEGQLPVLLAFFILSYNKQWKSLPFLFTGFILYAIIGSILVGDFWWYFTQSPYYMANDIYGVGKWNHYLTSYRNYIGNPGLYLIILGLPMCIYMLVKRQWNKLNFDATFLAYGTFLGVVFLHSYFWATGQNGSMGLTRIATQGATAFLMLQLIFVSYYPFWKNAVAISVAMLGFIGIGFSLIHHKKFPLQANPMEQLVINASDFANSQPQKGIVYYYFPLVGYEVGHNPKMHSKEFQFYIGSYFEQDVTSLFKDEDLLIWDSHFSPQEGTLPLEKLENSPHFKLVHIGTKGGDEVRIYQFSSVQQREEQFAKLEKRTIAVSAEQEFLDVFTTEELNQLENIVSMHVSGTNNQLRFVIDNEQPDGYTAMNIETIATSISAKKESKAAWHIYIWNPDKVEGTVNVSTIKSFDL